ncbi:MAG: PLP-dependent lyase/thiolase [Anaerolineae bacterium]
MPPAFRLTLGEGATPLEWAPELARAVGLEALWLKREDRNPTGSRKDRGVAFQLAAARAAAAAAGATLARIALSSSGNAAISAAAFGRAASVEVVAFVAPDTAAAKIAELRRLGAVVVRTPYAVGLCQAWSAARGVPNLRPSTDPNAVVGFQTLGWEIAAELAALDPARRPAAEAVFTFVSERHVPGGHRRAFKREVVVGTAVAPAPHAVQARARARARARDARARCAPPPRATRARRARARVDARRARARARARKTCRLGEGAAVIARAGGGGGCGGHRSAGGRAPTRLRRGAGIAVSIEGARLAGRRGCGRAERGVGEPSSSLTGAD